MPAIQPASQLEPPSFVEHSSVRIARPANLIVLDAREIAIRLRLFEQDEEGGKSDVSIRLSIRSVRSGYYQWQHL